MILLNVIVGLIVLPVVLATAFFAVEVLAGLWRLRGGAQASRISPPTVIIIPAHDEEAVIGRAVATLRSAVPTSTRILVVADNCEDGTADVAAESGAEVIVRDDPDRRGKGYALAAARQHLADAPPDVVVVVDADCELDQKSLTALSAAARDCARPCQAINLLSPDISGPVVVQISTFAFMIKNLIRQRGLQRLAGRCHLTGTGMAFPWKLFERADLGGSNIVEDLGLGLDFTGTIAPMLVEDAGVWSAPATAAGTLVQRRRWEGGYLATALRTAPAKLTYALFRGDLRGICAALDLCVPPLALLVVVNAVAFAIAAVPALAGGALWPLCAQIAAGILAVLALFAAWVREGRKFASGATLLRLPLYVLWKLPLYLGLARRGAPREWLRTER